MKTFRVNFSATVFATVEVDAETPEQAHEIVKEKTFDAQNIQLFGCGYTVDHVFEDETQQTGQEEEEAV